MRAIFLVAAREFRQIVATRGFWMMLLVVPLAIAVSAFASSKLAPERSSAFVLVDASGKYAPDLNARLEREYQRQVLREFSTYAERWKLAEASPNASWARRDSWLADSEVARFMSDGGLDAALAQAKSKLPADAPKFEAPDRYYVQVAPPPGVPVDQGAEAFGKAIEPVLQDDADTPDGKRPYALALYIPENFGEPGATVRVWTSGRPSNGLIEMIRDELTTALRQNLLQASGLPPQAAEQFEMVRAPLAVSEPPAGQGRSVIATRSIIPIALVYLLLITTITTGSMMLQGLVEERSNKLIESVLACIKPAALMHGKLLGLGAVGMCIILVWAGCAIGAAFSFSGVMSDFLRPSLEAIHEPWIVLAMLFYFLSGYVILSMVFLAIGSLSDSMQDAQAYLTPVLMLVMLPVMFLMQAALRGPDELVVHILSWIPVYTPFAMLARLGTGVSLVEVLGSGALLVAFIAIELVFLGRLFQSSLLSAGKPGWREVVSKLLSKPPLKQTGES